MKLKKIKKLQYISLNIYDSIDPMYGQYNNIYYMISSGLLTEEHSYKVDKTNIMYDPITFQSTYAYTIICNDNKCRKISKELIETFFQNTQEWREEQLNKLLSNDK